MKKLVTFFLTCVLLATGIVLTACGGGAEPATAADADTPVTFDFEGQDIAFDKNEITVSAGQEVTINFDNVGTLEHSWVLTLDNIDPLEATEADAIRGISSGTLAAGESTSFTFKAPNPGTYNFVCTVEGHAEAGMWGEMIVR